MCVIVYKEQGQEFPSRQVLNTCFDNNPDGCGYMYAYKGNVYIKKGFMRFNDFWQSLKDTRALCGDNLAYIMHFRISTQGGVRKDCCHPYPLSNKMDDLRQLRFKSEIGIAHNGIISLTSTYYNKTITYNDTMEFITDYLSLIIKRKDYYKDKDTLLLIERLCGSRLAILDNKGHCELIGNGWIKDNGVWYSNKSYIERKYTTPNTSTNISTSTTKFYAWDDWQYEDDYVDKYEYFYNNSTHLYEFDECDCPLMVDDDESYCKWCANKNTCYYNYESIEDLDDWQ